jgi:hypothetical protein
MADMPLGWKPLNDAPDDADLCLCVRDGFGLFKLPFPCRRRGQGWINSRSNTPLDIAPVGWIEWKKRTGRHFQLA